MQKVFVMPAMSAAEHGQLKPLINWGQYLSNFFTIYSCIQSLQPQHSTLSLCSQYVCAKYVVNNVVKLSHHHLGCNMTVWISLIADIYLCIDANIKIDAHIWLPSWFAVCCFSCPWHFCKPTVSNFSIHFQAAQCCAAAALPGHSCNSAAAVRMRPAQDCQDTAGFEPRGPRPGDEERTSLAKCHPVTTAIAAISAIYSIMLIGCKL